MYRERTPATPLRKYVSNRTHLSLLHCMLSSTFLAICISPKFQRNGVAGALSCACAPPASGSARCACAVCARVDGLCLVESIQARATAGLRREHVWCAMFSGGQQTRARVAETTRIRSTALGGTWFFIRVRGLIVHYGRRNRRRGSPAQGGGFTLRTPGGADPDGNSPTPHSPACVLSLSHKKSKHESRSIVN